MRPVFLVGMGWVCVCAGLSQRDQDTLIHLESFGVAVQKSRNRSTGWVVRRRA